MPKVKVKGKTKHFPYTKKGKKMAKRLMLHQKLARGMNV